VVYQGQSHASNTARTQHCLVVTGDELVRYLKMRGVAGTAEEILEVVHARLNLSSRTGFERLVSGVHDCSFLRPAVRPLASMLLRPGPERREVKLRQRWRRKDDSMRPTSMKGAAHRGGGAAKRRDKSRDIGHNGGALARAQRREKAKARGKKRRVRVVAAARQTTAGQVSLSLSSVTQAVSSVREAPGVVAPTLSAFMARAQASANRMFTF
jgi:hypothetical protein